MADTREALPAAVMQQLRYKAQRRGGQPVRGVQQQQQKASRVPQERARVNGEELDIGACMAALDDQPPTQFPANSPACRVGSVAVAEKIPAATTAHKQAVPAPTTEVACGPGDAQHTTGVFAKREKRKAEADCQRRVKKAAQPDGAGDLSFFMQLRKPGTGGGAAPAPEPALTDSGAADSTDSSAGTAAGEDSGTRNQPQVRLCCHRASYHRLALC